MAGPPFPERDRIDPGDGPHEQSPAVALLVERARAAGADLAVSPGNRPDCFGVFVLYEKGRIARA